MTCSSVSRRDWLKAASAVVAGGVCTPYVFSADAEQANRPQ